jgi:hypothetical protein
MKSSRRQARNVLAMPRADAAEVHSPATQVSEERIAQRAYELYCARGREDGHDLDDWLEAERDLRSDVTSSAA